MEHEDITWEAPEYMHQEKTSDWFWSVGIVGVTATVAAVVFNNVLFAALIFLGTVALLLQSIKHPRIFSFTIEKRGLTIGTTMYPFSSLDGFWIDDSMHPPRLLIKSKKLLMTLLVVHVDKNVDLESLRNTLLNNLPETELREPLFEKFMEYLGF